MRLPRHLVTIDALDMQIVRGAGQDRGDGRKADQLAAAHADTGSRSERADQLGHAVERDCLDVDDVHRDLNGIVRKCEA